MPHATHHTSRNGMPVHPRIVRYVVAIFLIASVVRVCWGAPDNVMIGVERGNQSNVVGTVPGPDDH